MKRQPIVADSFTTPATAALADIDTATLVSALAERLAIPSQDWHRLKGNRSARAQEQVAIALTLLTNGHQDEALVRLQQAVGWLDHSVSAPPCPTHGH